jgi:hypothetical protein
MEVKGSVTDRPWGMTLGAIALRRHTGQLTIESDGKRYCIAFSDGAIVAASSPAAADAIARIALTNHFITSTQVAEITRRLALSPDRDEVDVIADAIQCSADQVLKLRRRLVAQRAARTFSLDHGDFVLDERIALPVFAEVSIDHRHAIYLGVRTNLSEQRLIDDLRQLGSFFVLKPAAVDELPRFGFEPGAHPVIEALKLGTSLPELEASHRELDPRFAQAIIYALVSCTACVISPRAITAPPVQHTAKLSPREGGAAGTTTGASPPPPRSATPLRADGRTTTSPTAYSGTAAQDAGTNTPAATRLRRPSDPGSMSTPPAASPSPDTGRPETLAVPSAGRPRTPTPSAGPTSTLPSAGRPQTPPAMPWDATPPGTVAAPAQDASAAAAPSARRSDTGATVNLTDNPPPSPLPSLASTAVTFGEPQPTRARSSTAAPSPQPTRTRTPTPSNTDAMRGFGDQRTPGFGEQRTPGFSEQRTPGFSEQRTPGFSEQRTPGFSDQRTPGFSDQRTPSEQRTPNAPGFSHPPTGAPAPSSGSTDNALAAAAAFKRGELAMKRDQPGEAILEYKAACDLDPNEVDYAGMLAWAKFCAAGDKAAIGGETRKMLERAVFKSQRPERARFYLGRVERMLGRDKEALRQFQEVLELKPNHAEAASEVRAIEARLQASKGGTGLFGRKR